MQVENLAEAIIDYTYSVSINKKLTLIEVDLFLIFADALKSMGRNERSLLDFSQVI